ncbi:hypothetical protein HanRHA438_Chr07g0315071 [Helianthus annuus]|nr:hypothetical protein HanRHA438_Chr07g0315071 [Helianthus annuus]
MCFLDMRSTVSAVLLWMFLLYRMAADVNIRKTPTTKTLARILDNLLEDGAVHIRK